MTAPILIWSRCRFLSGSRGKRWSRRFLGVAPIMLRYMRNETEFESPLPLGSLMPGRGVSFEE